jgi:aminotransferase
MDKALQVCTVTAMDSSDPSIRFNEQGVCNYVDYFHEVQKPNWHPNAQGRSILERAVEQIKKDGKGKPYDCIVGLSGGLDSSYLAYKIKEFDLRVLAVHVDGGWNSETSVQNIEKIITHCGWDLHTYVVNWEEMRDLQLAYLKAGLVNQDVPQDHAFFAKLWQTAVENNLKWTLSGGNIASESILPLAWRGHNAMDDKHIRGVHQKYGSVKLKSYPTVSIAQYNLWFRLIKGMKVLKPLNYMPYDLAQARQELTENTGWRAYGDKHHESVFTKFFQGYYLPTKFGFDKRKAHLSSMILSGQATREEVMQKLAQLPYDPTELDFQKDYIAKKLRISVDELEHYIVNANDKESDFASSEKVMANLMALKSKVARSIRLKGQEYG